MTCVPACLRFAHGEDTPLPLPAMVDVPPGAGLRVRHQLPDYVGTQVYHTLYLPPEWRPRDKASDGAAPPRYPVIVEYAGNKYGPDKNGDICTGTPEGCKLGFGISGGRRFIWICLPYVNSKEKRNQLSWWGDVDATVDYCKRAVRMVCDDFGGDAKNVFITGFSRGAIACSYIGLRDDEIAALWRGFIPHSHFDGVRNWGYSDAVGDVAIARLRRGAGRPWFVTHETSVDATRQYVTRVLGDGAASFTFTALDTPWHTDTWVLDDAPPAQTAVRDKLRAWMREVLRPPGGGQ